MALSLKQYDEDWQDRFKKIYATNLTTLSLYPADPTEWATIIDVPYGMDQIERPLRRPDQRIHLSKEEEYPEPKYAASEVIKLDMINASDELHVKEAYYAGDTANALGHVADLNKNYKQGISVAALDGSTVLLQDTASTSTAINQPGHVDTASALSTVGSWDVYENMVTDLAIMDNALEQAGFFGTKALLLPGIARPFINRYVVDNTAVPYKELLGYRVYYSHQYDTGATKDAINVKMIQPDKFEIHMNPLKIRSFWSDLQETFVWRWKTKMVGVGVPMNNPTDWVKAIIGFDVDFVS